MSGKIDTSQQLKVFFDAHPVQFEGCALDQVRACTSKMRTLEGKVPRDEGALK